MIDDNFGDDWNLENKDEKGSLEEPFMSLQNYGIN
jgi:hypothetical protein